ncbi:MAG: FkbM family methyltransferase [Candidatus Omnitrophica bacterium]|nr:FkbM family methyltransferase [Candidatus Omnitrophota bacterium]
MRSFIFFISVKIFSVIQKFFHEKFNINLPGFEFLYGNIKRDYILEVNGSQMYFNHKIARAYDRLVAGLWNEPETHLFLYRILSKITFEVDFIDVGACVGEFVIDMARHKKVKSVFAYEPVYEGCKSINLSCSINEFKNVNVSNIALANECKQAMFNYNLRAPGGSSIFEKFNKSYIVNCSTLDIQFPDYRFNCIILADCEGSEAVVLEGGSNFIRNNLPLIIFEYNDVSRKHFDLNKIQGILGDEYKIYRLNYSGYLDTNYNDTWNMVAVNLNSPFYPAVDLFIKGDK